IKPDTGEQEGNEGEEAGQERDQALFAQRLLKLNGHCCEARNGQSRIERANLAPNPLDQSFRAATRANDYGDSAGTAQTIGHIDHEWRRFAEVIILRVPDNTDYLNVTCAVCKTESEAPADRILDCKPSSRRGLAN